MSTRRRARQQFSRIGLCGLALMTAVLVAGPSSAMAQAPTARLRILLTNDDGYEAGGIVALRDALIEGGHSVVVVAPTTNQSGSSARRSSGTLHYREAAPGVWHVDGSPADAVLLALRVLMPDSLPDLVVSGTNAGQNIGTSTSHSGTVGAAVTAVRNGIPAIAISAEIRRPGPTDFGPAYLSTGEAFGHAARFGLDLIDRLVGHPSETSAALLPPGTLLNVNYPALALEDVRGVRFMPVSNETSYASVYEETGTPGEVRVGLRVKAAEELEPGTDVAVLAQGFVTINLIEASGDAGALDLDALMTRLGMDGGRSPRD